MANFCTKCGSALDENGKCPKCDVEVKAEEKKPSEAVSPAVDAPKETDEKKEIDAPKENDADKEVGEKKENDANKEVSEKIENEVKQEIVEKKENPKKKKPVNESLKKKAKITLIVVIVVLSVYTVSLITLGTLVYFNKINIPFINDVMVYMGWKEEKVEEKPTVENVQGENPEQPEQQPTDNQEPVDDDISTRVDADEYYNNNTTVVSQFSVAESQDVHSEADAYDNFVSRGFNQKPITTNYSIEGEYFEEKEISQYSSTLHPVYQTWYVTSAGMVWQIVEINGVIMASGLKDDMSDVVVVSETDTITSYDSAKNKFYVNTPHESEMEITKVDSVDAKTLEYLN